jgi:hypothetical protein
MKKPARRQAPPPTIVNDATLAAVVGGTEVFSLTTDKNESHAATIKRQS